VVFVEEKRKQQTLDEMTYGNMSHPAEGRRLSYRLYYGVYRKRRGSSRHWMR